MIAFVIGLEVRSKIISVEELETKLPNLLDIPDTSSIHSLLSKHRSRLFPSYTCTSIQSCFGEEIAELKTALLENGGESDDGNVAGNKEGIQASTFNEDLKAAITSINAKMGFFSTGKKAAKHLVRAADYLLSAFFLLRSRLREFRNSPTERHAVISLMRTLLQHVPNVATRNNKDGTNSDRFEWLTLVREYRYYTHMKSSWRTLWFGKHAKEKLYTVPIPHLGSSFVTLWALGQSQNMIDELEAIGKFKDTSIKFWEAYPGGAKKCIAKTDDVTVSQCLAELNNRHDVLTVKKARNFVDKFERTPLKKLQEIARPLLLWISQGMPDTNDPFSPLFN